MIDNIDIKMKLLAGLPLEIKDVCNIYPLTLKEISLMNYTTYQNLLINLKRFSSNQGASFPARKVL
jgi:hypothetical protein